ncbi:MAG: hypothetical protein M3O70_08970 [Actinomycetota bacterium]|nr:hypothetical protein [Actinomycetota bacterium]
MSRGLSSAAVLVVAAVGGLVEAVYDRFERRIEPTVPSPRGREAAPSQTTQLRRARTMTSHIDLDTITLHSGGHDNPDQGHCLLEVVPCYRKSAGQNTLRERLATAVLEPALAAS